MARPLRVEYEGAFYHITARGNERKKIFFTDRDYARFIEYLAIAKERFGCVLHAYALMQNHYHLLLETPQGNLGKVMHYLNGAYTTYINVKRKRSGHLFQGRYKSIVIEKDSYLLELSRYVHLNPVRANMEERPEDYRYSSYSAYLSQDNVSIVFRDQVLEMLACNKVDAYNRYREFVESAIEIKTESPFKKVYGGMVLGSERFVKELLARRVDRSIDNDVSYRKKLLSTVSLDNVVCAVCERLNCSKEDLMLLRSGKARDLTIYLLKKQTSATNSEIGAMFGGLSNSAVAKVGQRFGNKMKNDEKLLFEVTELIRKLSRVKG